MNIILQIIVGIALLFVSIYFLDVAKQEKVDFDSRGNTDSKTRYLIYKMGSIMLIIAAIFFTFACPVINYFGVTPSKEKSYQITDLNSISINEQKQTIRFNTYNNKNNDSNSNSNSNSNNGGKNKNLIKKEIVLNFENEENMNKFEKDLNKIMNKQQNKNDKNSKNSDKDDNKDNTKNYYIACKVNAFGGTLKGVSIRVK